MRAADLDENNVIDLEEFIVFMRATEWKLQLGPPGRDRFFSYSNFLSFFFSFSHVTMSFTSETL
jgi:hypothetical protein